MSILKSTNSGKFSNITLETMKNRGYLFFKNNRIIKIGENIDISKLPSTFELWSPKYKGAIFDVNIDNTGTPMFLLSFKLNADEDKATGTVPLVVKTFNDLIIVEKFFQLKYESETTNKLLTNTVRFARMEILRNIKTLDWCDLWCFGSYN